MSSVSGCSSAGICSAACSHRRQCAITVSRGSPEVGAPALTASWGGDGGDEAGRRPGHVARNEAGGAFGTDLDPAAAAPARTSATSARQPPDGAGGAGSAGLGARCSGSSMYEASASQVTSASLRSTTSASPCTSARWRCDRRSRPSAGTSRITQGPPAAASTPDWPAAGRPVSPPSVGAGSIGKQPAGVRRPSSRSRKDEQRAPAPKRRSGAAAGSRPGTRVLPPPTMPSHEPKPDGSSAALMPGPLAKPAAKASTTPPEPSAAAMPATMPAPMREAKSGPSSARRRSSSVLQSATSPLSTTEIAAAGVCGDRSRSPFFNVRTEATDASAARCGRSSSHRTSSAPNTRVQRASRSARASSALSKGCTSPPTAAAAAAASRGASAPLRASRPPPASRKTKGWLSSSAQPAASGNASGGECPHCNPAPGALAAPSSCGSPLTRSSATPPRSEPRLCISSEEASPSNPLCEDRLNASAAAPCEVSR
eukprot:scaffold137832_cov28-Tisochrysis_lutea.AAC.5